MAQKKKRGCEVSIKSEKLDLNASDEETYKSHKYISNPRKGFQSTMRKIFKPKEKP